MNKEELNKNINITQLNENTNITLIIDVSDRLFNLVTFTFLIFLFRFYYSK